MTITGVTALSKEDIDRMVADAERFAAEDNERRQAFETRNAADQLRDQVTKALEEWGARIPESARIELAMANRELNDLLKGQDVKAIRSATDHLIRVYQSAGRALGQMGG